MTYHEGNTAGGTTCPSCGRFAAFSEAHYCTFPATGPQPQWSPPQPNVTWTPPAIPPQPIFGFRVVPAVCDHCWCMRAASDPHMKPPMAEDHDQCCNCGIWRKKAAPAPTDAATTKGTGI